jgi:Tfp pilus assembly protein PilF
MSQARRCSVALLSVFFFFGCGGADTKPKSQDDIVPLEGPSSGAQPAGANSGGVEAASSSEVAEAMKAIEAKRFGEAKTLLTKAIADHPKDAQAYYYLGVVESAEGGDVKRAVESYRKAIELDSKLVDAYVNLSALQLESKDEAGALKTAEQGLAVAKKQPDLALNRALALEALGRAEDALVAYRDAVVLRPDDFTLKVSYAQLLARAKKKTEALAQLSAVRECPDPKLLTMGAIIALNLDSPADCIALMDRGLKLAQHPGLYVRRGMCRDKMKDTPGATSDFKKAIELDARFAPAHYYWAQLLKPTDKAAACRELELAVEHGGNAGVAPGAKKEKAELGCE